MSKKINKQINYVQKVLKQDAKDNPKRSLSEFAELTDLIVEQFKDMNTFTIKQEKVRIS